MKRVLGFREPNELRRSRQGTGEEDEQRQKKEPKIWTQEVQIME